MHFCVRPDSTDIRQWLSARPRRCIFEEERDQKTCREELYGPRLFSTTLLMHAAQMVGSCSRSASFKWAHGNVSSFLLLLSLSSRLMDNDRALLPLYCCSRPNSHSHCFREYFCMKNDSARALRNWFMLIQKGT